MAYSAQEKHRSPPSASSTTAVLLFIRVPRIEREKNTDAFTAASCAICVSTDRVSTIRPADNSGVFRHVLSAPGPCRRSWDFAFLRTAICIGSLSISYAPGAASSTDNRGQPSPFRPYSFFYLPRDMKSSS